jgi:hypothetical protein
VNGEGTGAWGAGAWFVHGSDYDDYPLALFADELSARRWADEQGYGYVVFWPYGKDWREVKHDR